MEDTSYGEMKCPVEDEYFDGEISAKAQVVERPKFIPDRPTVPLKGTGARGKRLEALRSGLIKRFREQGMENPEEEADKVIRRMQRGDPRAPAFEPPEEKPVPLPSPREEVMEEPPITPKRPEISEDRSDVFTREYDPDIGYARDYEDFREYGIFGIDGHARLIDGFLGSEDILGTSLYRDSEEARRTMEKIMVETLDSIGLDAETKSDFLDMYVKMASTLKASVVSNIHEQRDIQFKLSKKLSMEMDQLEEFAKILAGIEDDNPLYNDGVRADYFLAQMTAWTVGRTMNCPEVNVGFATDGAFNLRDSISEHMKLSPEQKADLEEFIDYVSRDAVEKCSPSLGKNLSIPNLPPRATSTGIGISKEIPSSPEDDVDGSSFAYPISSPLKKSGYAKMKLIGPKRGRDIRREAEAARRAKGKGRVPEEKQRRKGPESTTLPRSVRVNIDRAINRGYDYSFDDDDLRLQTEDEEVVMTAMGQSGVRFAAVENINEMYDDETLADYFGPPGEVMSNTIRNALEGNTEGSNVGNLGTDEVAHKAEEVLRINKAKLRANNAPAKAMLVLNPTEPSPAMPQEQINKYRKMYLQAVQILSGEKENWFYKWMRRFIFTLIGSYTLKSVSGLLSTFLLDNDTLQEKLARQIKPIVDGLEEKAASMAALHKGLENAEEVIRDSNMSMLPEATTHLSALKGTFALDRFADPETGELSAEQIEQYAGSVVSVRNVGDAALAQSLLEFQEDFQEETGREPNRIDLEKWIDEKFATETVSPQGRWFSGEGELLAYPKREDGVEVLHGKIARELGIERGSVLPEYEVQYELVSKTVTTSINMITGERTVTPLYEPIPLDSKPPEIHDVLIENHPIYQAFVSSPADPLTHSRALNFLNSGDKAYLEDNRRMEIDLERVWAESYPDLADKYKYVAHLVEKPAATATKWFNVVEGGRTFMRDTAFLNAARGIVGRSEAEQKLFSQTSLGWEQMGAILGLSQEVIGDMAKNLSVMAEDAALKKDLVKQAAGLRNPASIMGSLMENMLTKNEALRGHLKGGISTAIIYMMASSLVGTLDFLSFSAGIPTLTDETQAQAVGLTPSQEDPSIIMETSWGDMIYNYVSGIGEGFSDGIIPEAFWSGTSWLSRFMVNTCLTLVTNHILKILNTFEVPFIDRPVTITKLPYHLIRQMCFALADFRIKGFKGYGKMQEELSKQLDPDDPSPQTTYMDPSDLDRMTALYEKYYTEFRGLEGMDDAEAIAAANKKAIHEVLKVMAWQRHDDWLNGMLRLFGLIVEEMGGPALNQAGYLLVKVSIGYVSSVLAPGVKSFIMNIGGYFGVIGTTFAALSSMWGWIIMGSFTIGATREAFRLLGRFGQLLANPLTIVGHVKRVFCLGYYLLYNLTGRLIGQEGIFFRFFRYMLSPRQAYAAIKESLALQPTFRGCDYLGSKGYLSLVGKLIKGGAILATGVAVTYAVLYFTGYLEDLKCYVHPEKPEEIEGWFQYALYTHSGAKAYDMRNMEENLYPRKEGEADLVYRTRVLTEGVVRRRGESISSFNNRKMALTGVLRGLTDNEQQVIRDKVLSPDMISRRFEAILGTSIEQKMIDAGVSDREREENKGFFTSYFLDMFAASQDDGEAKLAKYQTKFASPRETIRYVASKTGLDPKKFRKLGFLTDDEKTISRRTREKMSPVLDTLIDSGVQVLSEIVTTVIV